MKFSFRFVIVFCWMLSISLTSIAIAKRCEKKSTVVLQAAFKQDKSTANHYPVAAHQGVLNCSGSFNWDCIEQQNTIIHSAFCSPAYTFYTSAFVGNVIKNPPYAPPRTVLNSWN